jgi:complex III assembly factor LYRM7
MSNSQRALNAYRAALRSTRVAFTNDITTLTNARTQIRKEMESSVSLSNPKLDTVQRIELLEQVSKFLRHNVVQGVKKNTDESRYVLNIHEETELGDNDEIKQKKSTLNAGAAAGGGCCGNGNIELKQKN